MYELLCSFLSKTNQQNYLWSSGVRESVVHGHPQVHAKFEVSLAHMRLCALKEEKKFSLSQNVLMLLARAEEAPQSHWCPIDLICSWESKVLFGLQNIGLHSVGCCILEDIRSLSRGRLSFSLVLDSSEFLWSLSILEHTGVTLWSGACSQSSDETLFL